MNKVRLTDIAMKISSGLTPLRSNPEFWDSQDIPWVKTEQLGVKHIYDSNEKISKAALEKTSLKLNPINTLSIAMYGEGRTRGNVSILKSEVATNQACCNVVIDEKKANYEYVYYFLKTQYQELRNLSSGVRKNLNSNDIKNFAIRLPKTLNEQMKIAELLSSIDSKIELNNKINTELEAMVKLMYDYWFVQFEFPDGNGKPYKSSGGKMVYNEALKREIPDGWTVDVINNMIEVKDGTHDSPKPCAEGYYFITSTNLKVEGLDFENANLISKRDYENINKRSKVDTGDILFSMIGSIGVVYKVDEDEIDFAIKNVALYKTSRKRGHMNFIYMYLKSYDMQRYMGNVISGSIQKFIGLRALRNTPIFVDDNTINRYAKITEDLFKKLTLIKRENQKMSELRDWLLPMLMNGQVTVKDA
jgi:type I restriction enzyme S subunit